MVYKHTFPSQIFVSVKKYLSDLIKRNNDVFDEDDDAQLSFFVRYY